MIEAAGKITTQGKRGKVKQLFLPITLFLVGTFACAFTWFNSNLITGAVISETNAPATPLGSKLGIILFVVLLLVLAISLAIKRKRNKTQ